MQPKKSKNISYISLFRKILRDHQIPDHSIVLVTASFINITKPNSLISRAEMDFICKELIRALGKTRTIVVHAFTPDHGFDRKPFNPATCLSNCGYLSNFILRQRVCCRSLHPLHSVAAIGPHANYVCKSPTIKNYGLSSPFENITNFKDSFILRINIDPFFNSIVHHAEALFGVPYRYLKLLECKIINNKKLSKLQAYAHVRFKHIELTYTNKYIKRFLYKKKIIKFSRTKIGHIASMNCREYLNLLLKELGKNPYCFLKRKPIFKRGHLPRDGFVSFEN
jgi:aminoglycoside 3-N-acetyltransferase